MNMVTSCRVSGMLGIANLAPRPKLDLELEKVKPTRPANFGIGNELNHA
jgi:hypothetical protein